MCSGELYVDQPSSCEGDVFFSFSSSASPAPLLFLDGLTDEVKERQQKKGSFDSIVSET